VIITNQHSNDTIRIDDDTTTNDSTYYDKSKQIYWCQQLVQLDYTVQKTKIKIMKNNK